MVIAAGKAFLRRNGRVLHMPALEYPGPLRRFIRSSSRALVHSRSQEGPLRKTWVAMNEQEMLALRLISFELRGRS